ncbi:MAG: tetratricopeptide repeat protein [Saprospiraceae bacterium]
MSKLFTIALFGIIIHGCQTDPVLALQEKLLKIDKVMGGANVTDKAKAAEFVQTSEELALLVEKTNPDLYVDVLLKAAGLAKTIGNPQKAIELYIKIADGLPQHKKAPTALFMIGFVQENDLNDLEKAKMTYESFLQKYPNDPDFADDAQNAIKLLGKSPEEIIKEFEKQTGQEQK